MIKWILPILFLSGCTAPSTNQLYTPQGERVDIAYLVMNPLCLLICNTTVTTSGSDVDTIGQDASGSNTQSQTVSQQGVGGQ